MPLNLWSKTAANNSTADPSINWATGMSASSVDQNVSGLAAGYGRRTPDGTRAVHLCVGGGLGQLVANAGQLLLHRGDGG